MSIYHQKPHIFPQSLCLQVVDLQRSLLFYQEMIGLKVLKEKGRRVTLTADGAHPLLILEQAEYVERRKKRTTGLYHFALLVPKREDLANFLKHLYENNVAFSASDHYVSVALYINDPDGNGIEIYWDRPSVDWKWLDDGITMTTKSLDLVNLLKESSETYQNIPEQTVLGHMHLRVAHLDETERFYVDGLGFTLTTRYPGALFMATGGYHHHLACNIWETEHANLPEKHQTGLKWYAIVFPHEVARETVMDRLQNLQFEVVNKADFYEVDDPSGNKIRLLL